MNMADALTQQLRRTWSKNAGKLRPLPLALSASLAHLPPCRGS